MSDGPQDTIIISYREDGAIDRRRLSGILGAATTLLMLLLIVALSLGAIGAVGVGIGGFVIEFSDVSAASGAVYPALGQQSECDSAPQLMATLDGEAEIDGYFQITKGIPVPGETVGGVSVDVLSEAGNGSSISADSLDLHLTALSSQELVLGETTIAESGPSEEGASSDDLYTDAEEVSALDGEEIQTGFGVDASGGFGVIGGRAVVYQIAFDNIEIGGIGVSGSTYEAGNVTTAASYDCDELEPVAVDADGNFTLPQEGQGGVTTHGAPTTASAQDFEPQETAQDTQDEAPDESPDEQTADEQTDAEGEPELEVVTMEPPQDAELAVGDSLTAEVNVTNAGNATETWNVYMGVDRAGDEVPVTDQQTTVAPDETQTVPFEYEVTEADLPEVDAVFGVETDEDEADPESAEGEPDLDILDVTPPQGAEIGVGDETVIEARVSNVGNATETWNVYMEVEHDGEYVTVSEENVTVDPDASTEISFEYEATPFDVPEVDAVVGVDEPE